MQNRCPHVAIINHDAIYEKTPENTENVAI